jgi:outer membrane receptor protein involved in Fe transport
LLTFVNLTSGTINGFELEGFFQPSSRWHFSWSGHLLDGEDRDGGPLADIPADRLRLSARFTEGRWRARLGLQWRASKDDPGSGEKVIPSAQLLAASLRYQLTPAFSLSLNSKNLLDETYFSSADRRTPVAEGRSAGLALSWNPG